MSAFVISINLIPNTGGCPCTLPLGCGHDPHAAPPPCTAKDSRRTRARATANTLDSVRDHLPFKGTVRMTDAPPSSPALEGIAPLDVVVHRCCHCGRNHCRCHTSATPMRVFSPADHTRIASTRILVLIGCSGIGLSVQHIYCHAHIDDQNTSKRTHRNACTPTRSYTHCNAYGTCVPHS